MSICGKEQEEELEDSSSLPGFMLTERKIQEDFWRGTVASQLIKTKFPKVLSIGILLDLIMILFLAFAVSDLVNIYLY